MIISLIIIRLKQFYRNLSEAGLVRSVFLLLVVLPLVLYFIAKKAETNTDGFLITALASAVLFVIHSQRKDYQLIRKIASNPPGIFFIEYVVLTISLPFILIFNELYVPSAAFILLVGIISFHIPSAATFANYNPVIRFIPDKLFEWKSGVRKSFIFIAILWLLGLFGFAHIAFSAVSAILLTMTISTFYTFFEPRQILMADEVTENEFLRSKLRDHLMFFAKFLLPVAMIALVHPEKWMYILAAYFSAVNCLAFAILWKYAYYYPNGKSNLLGILAPLVCMVSVVLPLGFIILSINLILYRKAKTNLKPYLDANRR